ncbi:hypothetical protein GCM10027405_17700 [Arthrobacter alkaliphilus]|uniref:hypothetical protein n=1 Tax=Arthrobacter alkaliphilus TaxID=369936 RepID=UPI001F1BC9F8|nr:hypothetical protein [Arthrobacter alkaliphilus]
MSPETNNPVRDGIQNAADPIPREAVGVPAADDSSKGPQAADRSEPGGDDPGVHDPSGPAEEEDEASADQRGLTTELGPSD